MSMVDIVKVTAKGQLTLPVKIRRDLGISEDTYLVAEEVGDFVLLQRSGAHLAELGALFRREVRRKGVTKSSLLRA